MTIRLTPEQAAALGLVDRKPPRGTRKTLPGPYRSRCCHCPATFDTQKAEDRHLADTGHTRYSTLEDS